MLLPACAAVGTEPLPGRPLHHVEGGFRNPNPEFRPPGGWARARFLTGRVWASLVAPRSFEASRVPVGGGLSGGDPTPTVTWIGHATLLIHDVDARAENGDALQPSRIMWVRSSNAVVEHARHKVHLLSLRFARQFA
jgi:hypothetical protein